MREMNFNYYPAKAANRPLEKFIPATHLLGIWNGHPHVAGFAWP
jgi:hypothetical protein